MLLLYFIVKNAVAFFIILGIASLIVIFILVFKNPALKKGKSGEKLVAKFLKKIAKKENGFLVNDLLFKNEDDSVSTQLDHVYVNKTGIYVIETKNYSGIIYGDDKSDNWTQILKESQQRKQFYSPVKQNAAHVYKLASKLNVKIETIYSVVLFVGKANLIHVKSDYVYSLNGLLNKIQNSHPIYSCDSVEVIKRKLIFIKENNLVTSKSHIKEIKNKQKNLDRLICPRCSGKLIIRTSKNGKQFYGCSNYPKCKFTKRFIRY